MQVSWSVSAKSQIDRTEFLANYFDRRPVILRSIASHWPAVMNWTPQVLTEKYGDLTTDLLRYDPNEPKTFLEQTYDNIIIGTTLANYLSSHSSDPAFAIREDRYVFLQDPRLIEDMNYFEPFCPRTELRIDNRYCSLWMGPQGHQTGLHADFAHLFLIQVAGSKRVLMFDHEQTDYLYEETWNTSLGERVDSRKIEMLKQEVRWSRVEPGKPNYSQFPLFRQAEAGEAVLEAGDALYIPDRWWHWVQSLSDTISVSFEIEPDTIFCDSSFESKPT